MSEPYETLKNWTHWGVMGVINPRHSAGDYQNESFSSTPTRPAELYIFTGVMLHL